MSLADAAPAPGPAFSSRTMLALVLVGIVSLAGLAVLSAYAPDLRGGNDGQAHALSKSAIGYSGAPILMQALGAPVVVSRARPLRPTGSVVILTPQPGLDPKALQAYPKGPMTLIVLPKWAASPDPLHQGWVRKLGLVKGDDAFKDMLSSYAPASRVARSKGRFRHALRGTGGPFAGDLVLPLGPVDRLQTLSGDGWAPVLVDEGGRAVLARSRKSPGIWVLADPDLLNNQGLANLETARAASVILTGVRGGKEPLLFDVTLNGFERGRGLGRLMLEPPWLAATLIAVATGVLMGLHALARFGQPRRKGRAFALGGRALVDNSADLVRMARKEHEFAPAYALLTNALVTRGAGHTDGQWLDELARRRGLAAPDDLAAEAARAKTRDDLLAVARKLHDWRGEMTRERR